MSEADPVLCDVTDDIAVITLNAPEKRNAIDLAMVQAMHRVLDELEQRPELAAIVLTGAGEKAFAAGADIAQLEQRKSADALAAINSRLFMRVEELAVPVIAAIRGFALGGGCELALACDVRIAGRSAKMGQPEVKLGIIPGAGGTYRLPRVVGHGMARELIYTGRILDADGCLAIGLVNSVVGDAEVLDAARALATEIAGNGRLAVRMAKATMNAIGRPGQAAAMSMESAAQAVLFDSDDKHQRMRAFLDRSKKSRENR